MDNLDIITKEDSIPFVFFPTSHVSATFPFQETMQSLQEQKPCISGEQLPVRYRTLKLVLSHLRGKWLFCDDRKE